MPGPLQIQKKKTQSQHDVFFNKKIVAPEKLKILVLSGNDIISDELEFIHRCVNIVKLDLSNNHITKITPKARMDSLKNLQILYLHHNKIQSVSGMEGVFTIPKLIHLTIRENPLERLPRIEHLLINMIPTLKILGDRVIFVEERSSDFFEARNPIFIDIQVAQGWKTKDNMESQYMKIMEFQIKYFDHIWHFSNPIIVIQRMWKKCLEEKRKSLKFISKNKTKVIHKDQDQDGQKISPIDENSEILNNFFTEWRIFTKNRILLRKQLSRTGNYPKDKTYMMEPLPEYRLAMRNLRVESIIKKYVEYIRNKIFLRRMAKKIKAQLKVKQIQFHSSESFYSLTSVKKTNRFYFSKIQGHLLENFLLHMGDNFNWRERIHNSTSTGQVTHYLSIRMLDPESYAVKRVHSVLTYMLWPSMRAIFLKKKNYESKQRTGMIKIKPLTYIKNHNKILTNQQRKKSNKIYKQLQKFYKKQYENSLDYFSCQDEEIMLMLIRYIYYHNTKTYRFENKLKKNDMQSLLESYDEPFLIYEEGGLRRAAAAVRIQQNWRKYLVRKNQQTSIYEEMKKTRAILRIQRFWRDQIFYHRLSFQKSMTHELKLFKSNSFLISKQIYIRINELLSQKNKICLFENLAIRCNLKKKIIWNEWSMLKDTMSYHVKKNYFRNREIDYEGSQTVDGFATLHCGAQVSQLIIGGEGFYQFSYQNLEECRNRVFVLALASYRVWGSRKFIPLSKETMDLHAIRTAEYNSLGLLPAPESKQKNNTLQQQQPNYDKIITAKRFNTDGVFLTTQKYTNILEEIKKERKNLPIHIQFYQKIYQDFPKKYVATLEYVIMVETQLEKEERFRSLEKMIKEHQIRDDDVEGQGQGEGEGEGELKMPTIEIQRPVTDTMFTINKIDKKRLSFYDHGGKREKQYHSFFETRKAQTGPIPHQKNITSKKQFITKSKADGTQKKKQILEKKTNNLRKIREDVQKQKVMNSTMKNLKDMEYCEALRRKVSKVKQMKERIKKSKRDEMNDEDFIQQGNFVMQQQLKMVVMRSKLQNISVRHKDRSDSMSSKTKNSALSRSFYTEEKPEEKKTIEEQETKVVNSLGATVRIKASQNIRNDSIEGDEREIINVRRKSRAHSIGAYLRDPSYVHGVFPEEYYPIQSKGAMFKFFPPL